MRRLLLAASVMVLAAACSGAGSATSRASTSGSAPSTTQVSSTSIFVAADTRVTLQCREQIGWPRAMPPGYTNVLGKVALPTKQAFGAPRLHPRNPKSKYFAKQGLLIKPGAKFELVVPKAWASRVTFAWGNPGKETNHLYVTGCQAEKDGKVAWIAFVGGFTVDKPACVPLIVKAGTRPKTVHVGAGKACPGQTPPPK